MKRKITFIAVVIASSFVGMAQAHLNLTDALGGSSDEAVAFRKWVLATHKIDSSVFDYSNNAQNTFVNSPTTNIGNSNQTAHNLLDNHNYDLQTYWIPQFESAWSELPKPTNTTTTPSGNYNRGGTPTYSIPDNTPKPVYYGPTQRPNTSVEIENAKPETPHLDGQHNVEINPAHGNPEGVDVAPMLAQQKLTADKYAAATVPVQAPHLDGQHNVEINPAHGNPEGVDVAPMLAQQKLTADKYAAATVPVQAPHLDGQHNVEINPAHGNPEGVDVAPMLAQQKLTSEKYASQNISDKRVSSSNETTLNKKQSLASRKVAEIAQYNAMQLKIDNMALADNHHRIASNSAAISSNSQRLDSVQHHQAEQDSRINENKKQASAGISAAFAQANIPQVTDSQQFAVGTGVGGYDSENAIAVGASFHATQNTIVKMTVSDDTQNNFGYGAGVSVGW
ncbi:YadA C-terminal domain-containing protein [Hafnia paralvei]|uniref:YadA C-terminal domain-containing protein n=1 Tax=Hafnia paralvei TaxID=546367 RepID=UPI001F1DD84A|nr:YadA C-terminal domain-containing protein [Hafnia paralvei]MCE9920022.1 YadA C-terminal domain-containing protein [Hafnia paralvei]